MKIKHILIALTLATLFLVGCAEVTESTGKVLDSAGSVTRSASEKAWISNQASATPTAKANVY